MSLGYFHFDNKSLGRFIGLFLFVTTLMGISSNKSYGQATLSVQGILKKANGTALEDGNYKITFRIYPLNSPPNINGALWTEEIPDVDLNGGIYSVVLGKIEPLALPFNEEYELGVQLETAPEMSPRIQLTSAPYALALRGTTNQFPSAGLVLADNLRVAEGVLARAGAPGLSGANKNGYGMIGNNDTGVFSTAYGKVSLFVNNVEKLEATGTGVTIYGSLTATSAGANSINLYNNGSISYSTTSNEVFQDWRLADVDDLGSHDGWLSYSPNGQNTGWNNSTPAGQPCLCNGGVYSGNLLQPSANNQVLKKMYDIPGNWSQVKVKFKYYFFVIFYFGQADMGFAGFATDASGTAFKVGWSSIRDGLQANGNFNNSTAIGATNIGGLSDKADHSVAVEMTARRDGNFTAFWVFIGAALNENDEHYAVGPIEVWVR